MFKHDHLAVFIDTDTHMIFNIVNDDDAFKQLYENNKNNIWIGFNNKHYDQYIYKAILLGIDPKKVSDAIVINKMDGWQISREFRKIPMINYDVLTSKSFGLKTLEGFMGNNIKETSVPFDIDRPLTDAEIQETIKYCTWDVENTAEVFMETIDTFNAFIGLIEAFPKELSILNLADSSAQITSNVLKCERGRNGMMKWISISCPALRSISTKKWSNGSPSLSEKDLNPKLKKGLSTKKQA